MTIQLRRWFVVIAVGVLLSSAAIRDSHSSERPSAGTLLRESLIGLADQEVIVNEVDIPPNTELPWHSHPGTEIFYVLSGSIVLMQRNRTDIQSQEGEVRMIPRGVVHSGKTAEEGASLLIVRVHDAGQPERILETQP